MLKVIRVILVSLSAIVISLVGTVYGLVCFRNRSCASVVARAFGSLYPLVGLKVIKRPKPEFNQPAIYIGNHQSYYDMITIIGMSAPRTISIGKRSLIWVPFFGLVYWATNNILLHRENRGSAISTMNKVSEIIRNEKVSIWIYPEGTRSLGQGLLPFKTGAFHTALAAGVPIVPVVCSTIHNKVDLNRWDNGILICETLEPIDTSGYNRKNLKELIEKCHTQMAAKLVELDEEVARLEAEAKGKKQA